MCRYLDTLDWHVCVYLSVGYWRNNADTQTIEYSYNIIVTLSKSPFKLQIFMSKVNMFNEINLENIVLFILILKFTSNTSTLDNRTIAAWHY